MKNSKLGCLTNTGMIALLITVLSIAGIAFSSGSLMFSAGDLNAQEGKPLRGVSSHAQIKKCSDCHAAVWGTTTMADRCAACHTDIAAQFIDATSLHGTLAQNSPSLACRSCHPEHRGASAPLTELNEATFPHEALGYSLKAHQLTVKNEPFTCADCHQDDITIFASNTCDDCHRQMDSVFALAHAQAYGTACLDCHDGVDNFGETFDHAGFAFKLEGGHAGLACEKCHSGARVLTDFANAAQDCYACHKDKDEHNGQFGTDCAACHNPSSWEDAKFDHSLSNFPLTGKHVNVACEDCHKNGQFKVLNATCVSCHAEPAEHAGKFGTDCGSCHSTTAWSPATFNGKHTFPLNHGEGGAVSCATCHPSDFKTYTCYGCHEHNESRIRSKHLEEGISNFENCVECHADGREHD
ncbi:MAG: hypothetical protein HZB50_17425 [Chloroflexi bacterium]|nr:hypothetical protein [Chloroflexota bacterium]